MQQLGNVSDGNSFGKMARIYGRRLSPIPGTVMDTTCTEISVTGVSVLVK